MVACDFCGQRPALLYCRADSAKLCLPCDQHVHSANTLSKKHIRSQICDNCAAEPASVRCATDGLLLCQDCDWDAHGSFPVSASHDCCPMEGFTGCPSAFDLALAWGLEIEDNKTPSYEWGGLLEELMVPNASWVIHSNCGSQLVKKSPSCGKKKHVILKQLLELLADGGGGEGGEDVRPRMPSRGGWLPENVCKERLQEENKQQQPPEDGGFTSLLMMQTSANPEDEANTLWNPSTCRSAQIWDFNLGKLRGHDESGDLELEYTGSDMVYPVKNYGELLKESSLAKRRGLDLSGVNYSIVNEDIFPVNSTSNNQGHATLETNNLPVPKLSSYLGFSDPKNFGGSKDLQSTDQSIIMKSESMPSMTKAEMELLAQIRGNAMQRYKEKKKSRRYEKQIRYESRKARAQTRKRVKGRFVKASKAPAG